MRTTKINISTTTKRQLKEKSGQINQTKNRPKSYRFSCGVMLIGKCNASYNPHIGDYAHGSLKEALNCIRKNKQ